VEADDTVGEGTNQYNKSICSIADFGLQHGSATFGLCSVLCRSKMSDTMEQLICAETRERG
jgi:hypothetical protein